MANPKPKAPPPWPADQAPIRRKLSELLAYAQNARTHSDEQIDQIAASMGQFGFTFPVLVDENDELIAGHGRVLGAARAGFDEAPTITARGWTKAQIRAYRIADNKISLNSGWDLKLLAAEMGELGDLADMVGFSEGELKELFAPPAMEVPEDPPTPELPTNVTTLPGDVWQLGTHRLICGDCRDGAVIASLVGDRQINVAFTSPPYAEQRDYDASSGFVPIRPDDYVEWFAPVAANVATHLAEDGSWFVNIKPNAAELDTSLYVFDLVLAHVREWGWHFATEFCWERNGVPKQVSMRFRNQFEPIYQFAMGKWKMRPDAVRHDSQNVPRSFGKGAGNTNWKTKQGEAGEMNFRARKHPHTGPMSNVQGISSEPGEEVGPGLAYPGNRLPTFAGSHEALGHAAAFPVGLPDFFIKAYSDPGDVVLDPFAGSGSTLMASELSGRIGLACELSPAYCDVIVTRWQDATGEAATLASNGKSFAATAKQRQRTRKGQEQ